MQDLQDLFIHDFRQLADAGLRMFVEPRVGCRTRTCRMQDLCLRRIWKKLPGHGGQDLLIADARFMGDLRSIWISLDADQRCGIYKLFIKGITHMQSLAYIHLKHINTSIDDSWGFMDDLCVQIYAFYEGFVDVWCIIYAGLSCWTWCIQTTNIYYIFDSLHLVMSSHAHVHLCARIIWHIVKCKQHTFAYFCIFLHISFIYIYISTSIPTPRNSAGSSGKF